MADLFLQSHDFLSKNVGSTFQQTMAYVFSDLGEIILSFLDDLTTKSNKRLDHLQDLCTIFTWCHKYNILLNTLKCIFYIIVGHLLGFIFLQAGITMDSLEFKLAWIYNPHEHDASCIAYE